MDRYSKHVAIANALRNSTCEVELVTPLHLDDGTISEIVNLRRAAVKKVARKQNKTVLTLADLDSTALERVYPSETFTVAGFPELFIDHVDWYIPDGVGTVTKVPLAWIKKTGAWVYAGPRVPTGSSAVLAVYRGTQTGQGAIVDPSEYTVGTTTDAVSGLSVITISFTREQSDFQGKPYVIEADFTLTPSGAGTTWHTASAEIKRILTAFGLTVDSSSFTAPIAADDAAGFYVDALYGSRKSARTGSAILADLCRAARAWIVRNSSGQWGITQEVAVSSTAQFDTGADDVEIIDYGDGDISNKVAIEYRPKTAGLEDYSATMSRTTVAPTGEMRIRNPYLRDHTAADKLLSYWQLRLNSLRLATARIYATQLTNGTRISITDSVYWIGVKEFLVVGVTRRADHNELKLREYDASIYTYVAGTLPTNATNTYSPDYSYTLPAAPTSLAVISQGSSIDADGKITAYALIRAVPPTVNWARLMFQITDTGTNEIYQAQARLVSGNYEATISGLRPGRAHNVVAWAANANNVDGISTSSVGFTSATSANAPSAVTVSAGQNGPKHVQLVWTGATPGAGSTPVAEYIINRKVGAGSYAEWKRHPHAAGSISWIDDQVTLGTAYEYKLNAVDSLGNVGADSNLAGVTPVKLISDSMIVASGVNGASIGNGSINQGRTFTTTTTFSGTLNNGFRTGVSFGGYALFPSLTCDANMKLETYAPQQTNSDGYLEMNNDTGANQGWKVVYRSVSP
jgi:hypothetical protein